MRDKVCGMFMGTAIGDSLGMPVETWTSTQIRDKFPDGIKKYESPNGHKWFDGLKAGSWTDDTQLTLAVARGLIDAKGFDLNSLAQSHVDMMEEVLKTRGEATGSGVPGWGYSTAESIRRMANNVSWIEAGKTSNSKMGHGNGVVMRIAPLAAWFVSLGRNRENLSFNRNVVDFSCGTHYTQQSAESALLHIQILFSCFCSEHDVDMDAILNLSTKCLFWQCGKHDVCKYSVNHLNDTGRCIFREVDRIEEIKDWTDQEIADMFGGGSCNVTHSLPFTYAHWIKDYRSVDLLYRIVEAGGDTDSNASIAGGMLGAVHGMSVFPKHLIDGLDRNDEIMALANEFCDTFMID